MTNTPIVLLGRAGTTFTYRAYSRIAPLFGAPALNGRIIEATENPDILEALRHNPDAFGLIAVETQAKGRIVDSLEAFDSLGTRYSGDHPIRIIGGAKMPLWFALMTNGIRFDEIEGVVAHEQALEACKELIKRYDWKKEKSTSNGQAAADVKSVPRLAKFAALGPIEAAHHFKLTVVDEHFQSGVTTFFLLTSGTTPVRTGPYNRALVTFGTRGGAGALHDATEPFKRYDVNMIYLHSVHRGNGKYGFVTEVECTSEQLEQTKLGLEGLRKITENCAIFGPFAVTNL